jgi:hypothetical protein
MGKFNHLNVPNQWQHYWSSYPEGYTILEALLNWVRQVNDMTDNMNSWDDILEDFIQSYDKDLQDTVAKTVEVWRHDGTLDQYVEGVLFPTLYPLTIVDDDNFTLQTEHFYNPATPLEYWVTTIKPKSDEALKTLVKKDYAYSPSGFDSYAKEAVHDNAYRNKARFAINASGWMANTDGRIVGVQVKDGVVQKNSDTSLQNWYTLGVDSKGLLQVFPATVTGEQLVNDHDIVNTWGFSIPLVQNGAKVAEEVFQEYSPSYFTPYARQVVGQVEGTNDIVILTVDKHPTRSEGLTLTDCADIMVARGCRVAYNLDGGGSTQTVLNGEYLNTPSDGIPRPTSDILYFGKYERFEEYAPIQKELFSAIGSFESLSAALLKGQNTPLTEDNGTATYTNRGEFDFNLLYGTKFFRHYTDTEQAHLVLNAPFEESADYYILNIQSDSHSRAQLVLNRSNGQIAYRFNNLGSWSTWKYLDGNMSKPAVEIPLENGWTNVGGSDPKLQYIYKNGVMEVKGVIKGTNGNTVAGSIPPELAPKTRLQTGTVRNDGTGDIQGRLFITTSGAIIPIQPASQYIYIETTYLV